MINYVRQFFHHFRSERTKSRTNPPELAREFAQASICKAHLLRADTPTVITTFA